ncbi:MAG: molybdenum cofactor guanylyltransferase [Dehalococcoidales bacterium]|nr:molybdenum cofactor guanylyltransferase [Dehalococcoidales bacterium]
MIQNLKTSGIVLSGGKSLRFGSDKSMLTIGNKSFLERVVSVINILCDEIIVVALPSADLSELSQNPKIKIKSDIYPDKGPLAGIHTGLSAAISDYSIVVACDMPFLQQDLLHYMISISAEYDVVIPRTGNLIEPLHAVYNKRCLDIIEGLLNMGIRKISDLLPLVKVRYVDEKEIDKYDPQRISFFNINTRQDLERAMQLIKSKENSNH